MAANNDIAQAKPVKLLRCTVFCRLLAPEDEDATPEEIAEEILYFYPSNTSTTDQLHFINTCEGFIDFSKTFNSDSPIETIHFGDSRVVVHEVEPDTFFLLQVTAEVREEDSLMKKEKRRISNAFGRRKAPPPIFVSAVDEIADNILYDIVSDMYEMYVMFRGKIASSLFPKTKGNTGENSASDNNEDGGEDILTQIQNCRIKLRKAKRYSDARDRGDLDNISEKQERYIKELMDGTIQKKLNELEPLSPAIPVREALRTLIPMVKDSVDFANLNFFHSLDGFKYLPVDKDSYLDVFAYVIGLERLFESVEGVSILYQGHMVWNTLRHEDMRLLLKFIRYHEMIGLRSSNKEVRLSTIGFLSNLRGEYVKPEPPADTNQTTVGVNNDGGKDQNGMDSANNNSRRRATSRTSSLFTPPLCIPRREKDRKHSSAQDDDVKRESLVKEYDNLRTQLRDEYNNGENTNSPEKQASNSSNGVNESIDTPTVNLKEGENKSNGRGNNGVNIADENTNTTIEDKKKFEINFEHMQDHLEEKMKTNLVRGSKWRRKASLSTYYCNKNSKKYNPAQNAGDMPKYFSNSQHRLVIYKHGPMILVLAVHTDKMKEANMNEFCLNVEPTAEKGLKSLGKMLHDGYQVINARMYKRGNIASKYQFIYFNRTNLALKVELEGVAGSSIDMKMYKKNYKQLKIKKQRIKKSGRRSSANANDGTDEIMDHPYWPDNSAVLSRKLALTYSPVVVRMINDIYIKLNEEYAPFKEIRDIHVKLPSDGWVYGKKSGDRILIVLIDGRYSPVDAQNTVDSLCDTVFKGIF
eukprot:g4981.t1